MSSPPGKLSPPSPDAKGAVCRWSPQQVTMCRDRLGGLDDMGPRPSHPGAVSEKENGGLGDINY